MRTNSFCVFVVLNTLYILIHRMVALRCIWLLLEDILKQFSYWQIIMRFGLFVTMLVNTKVHYILGNNHHYSLLIILMLFLLCIMQEERTPLHEAVRYGGRKIDLVIEKLKDQKPYEKVVKILLQNSADVKMHEIKDKSWKCSCVTYATVDYYNAKDKVYVMCILYYWAHYTSMQ